MQFTIIELEREPIDFAVDLAAGSIDFGDEAEQAGALHSAGRVEVLHEHRGPREIVADIRLKGSFQGAFQAPCARCVEPVCHALAAEFDLLFRPRGVDDMGSERAISSQETEIGYYEGDGLSLEDVLREQVLLALPAKTLCKPDCKGLCQSCGQNRNLVACDCEANRSDPRWSALASLESKLKP